jgi:hypothetical protein
MEQQITQARQGFDFFNQLTQQGASTALIVAMILSLGFSMAMKVTLHVFSVRDLVANWAVYMTCIFGGLLASLLLWPPGNWRHTIAWSLGIAFATPLLWMLIVALVGLFRPQWARALSLHRINFDDAISDDAPPQGCSKPEPPVT